MIYILILITGAHMGGMTSTQIHFKDQVSCELALEKQVSMAREVGWSIMASCNPQENYSG